MLAIHFTDTITLGALIIGAAAGLAGLVTFGYGVRWKSNYDQAQAGLQAAHDTINVLAEAREAYKLEAERQRDEAREQRELKHRALTDLAAATLKTDLTGVLTQFQKQHLELMNELKTGREHAMADMTEQLQRHEDRAIERHDVIVEVLRGLSEHITGRAA